MAYQATMMKLGRVANDGDLTPVLHKAMLSMVRKEGADLTARQLGILLTVYLDEGPHTVRGLAAEFNICKPAVTRALDKLGELDLAGRKADPADRRSVLVERTPAGWAFLEELRRSVNLGAVCPRAEPRREWPKPAAAARRAAGHGLAFAEARSG